MKNKNIIAIIAVLVLCLTGIVHLGITDSPFTLSTSAETLISTPKSISIAENNGLFTVDGTKYTFGDPSEYKSGALLTNPFKLSDSENGFTINMYFTPSVDITSSSKTIPILAVTASFDEAMRFDLAGTRRYEMNSAGEWIENIYYNNITTEYKAGTEYMLSIVVSDGLDFFVNGVSVGRGSYSSSKEASAKDGAEYIMVKPIAKLYLGGSEDSLKSIALANAMPKGSVVRDITGFEEALNAEQLVAIYNKTAVFATAAPTEAPTAAPTKAPTEAPTIAPTAAPTSVPTIEPTEVPTTAPTQAPTEIVTQVPTEEPSSNPDIVWGDINGDTKVDAKDALIMLKKASKIDLDETELKNEAAADVNGDNYINAKDALLVLQHAARLIETFPVEE